MLVRLPRRLLLCMRVRRLLPAAHSTTTTTSAAAAAAAAPVRPPEARVQASIQAYDRHIFIAASSSFTQWPKRLEERPPPATGGSGESIYASLIEAIKAKAFTSHNPLPKEDIERMPPIHLCPRLTVFDAGSSLAASPIANGDLLVFSLHEPPAHLAAPSTQSASTTRAIDLRSDTPLDLDQELECKRVLKILDRPLESAAADAQLSTKADDVDFEIIAFVCCHTQRDQRCGDRGPPVVEAINQYAASLAARPKGRRVRVRAFPCSHVGGHEFSGNVLLYGWKRKVEDVSLAPVEPIAAPYVVNDWFGLIQPSDVAALLNAYADFMPLYLKDPVTKDESKALRRHLLQQSITPSATDAACSKCDSKAEPIVSGAVTALAHLWRGSMGIEKADARNIAKGAADAVEKARAAKKHH